MHAKEGPRMDTNKIRNEGTKRRQNNRRWTQIYADGESSWSAASLARPTEPRSGKSI